MMRAAEHLDHDCASAGARKTCSEPPRRDRPPVGPARWLPIASARLSGVLGMQGGARVGEETGVGRHRRTGRATRALSRPRATSSPGRQRTRETTGRPTGRARSSPPEPDADGCRGNWASASTRRGRCSSPIARTCVLSTPTNRQPGPCQRTRRQPNRRRIARSHRPCSQRAFPQMSGNRGGGSNPRPDGL